ncbi:MAG TPA: hypothetical protein VNO30_00030 [Kofleriaceae bacterium]|nr:hypothetical protein [Kofleriaceae bacterium]
MRRSIRVGEPTSVTLPEPLGPVTFEMSPDQLSATWSTLPEYDELSLVRESYSRTPSWTLFHELRLSSTFVNAVGAASMTMDFGDVPGFKSGWLHDPANAQFRAFVARRGDLDTEGAIAGVAESLTTISAPAKR